MNLFLICHKKVEGHISITTSKWLLYFPLLKSFCENCLQANVDKGKR